MLQNRIYRGEITHQGAAYSGQHQAILDPELWQIVQDKLAANRQERALAVGAEAPSLLAGLMGKDRRGAAGGGKGPTARSSMIPFASAMEIRAWAPLVRGVGIDARTVTKQERAYASRPSGANAR
jgi:hypothetical protein